MIHQTYSRDSLGLLSECQGNLDKAECSDVDSGDFPGGPEVKNLPCNAGEWVRSLVRIPPGCWATKPELYNWRSLGMAVKDPQDATKILCATTKAWHSQVNK